MKVRLVRELFLSSPLTPSHWTLWSKPLGVSEGMENWDWSEDGIVKWNTVLTEKASLPNINSASEKKKKDKIGKNGPLNLQEGTEVKQNLMSHL